MNFTPFPQPIEDFQLTAPEGENQDQDSSLGELSTNDPYQPTEEEQELIDYYGQKAKHNEQI